MKLRLIFLSILILSGIAMYAQPAPEKITSVEGITEYRLANGLQVLLFPDNSKPTITVNITYRVGSRHEGYGETGMAHLLEHMVFKGSTKHKDIPTELTNHGANANGTTWYDRTNYYETFSATDENLNWALDLESDRMVNSFIDAKDLASEFSVVRNEFESGENNPSGVLMERVISAAYLWHNYGKSTIGSKEDIERVPIDNLKAFYKKYYQPDNATLIVAGKIDEAKTLALVNKYFGNIPKPTRVLQPTYTVEPTQDGERFVELNRSGEVQVIGVAYHIPNGPHPDYAAVDVLNEVLTDKPSGRLYESLIKTEKASGLWSWAAGLHDPGFIYINVDVLKEKSLDEARKTLFVTLDELTSKPVTEEEVTRAKTKLLSSYENAYRNTEAVGTLLSEYIAMGDWRTGFLYRDHLKKVTAADVNKAVADYFMTSNRSYGIFVPTPDAKRATIPENPDLATLLKDYKGEAAVAAGEDFDASTTNIDKRSETIKAKDGGKILLLKKSTRGNTVNLQMTIRVGNEKTLQDKSAIASLTASMLKRGTQKRSMAEINDYLNKLQSSINIYGAQQSVSISIASQKQHLPQVLDLLKEILQQPSFPESEFKVLVNEQITSIEQQKSEPESIADRELSRIGNKYPPGHVLHADTFDESLAAIKAATLADIHNFYKDFYNGNSATIAVVGDFDDPVVKAKLREIVGFKKSKNTFTRVPNPYSAFPAEDKEFNTPDKKNAMLLTLQEIEMKDDNADYPALRMADFILGGGFLNSRLATRIRQKEGLSYGVGSYLQPGTLDNKTVLGGYAIYNPENKDKLIAAYKEEVKKFVDDGITQQELDDARKGYLQYRENGRTDDRSLSSKLSSYLYLGRTMAFDNTIDEKIKTLTVAQVNAAIKKYIDPSNMSFIKAGDFK